MKRTATLFALLLAAASVSAQFWTTAVGTSPDPATACGPFDLVIDGNKPATNYNLSSASATVVGSTINVDVEFTASGFGLPTITPVTYSVPVSATLNAGVYTVVVDYVAAGNTEISTWTITVDSCGVSTCGPDPTGLASSPNADGSVDLSWNAVAGSVACRVRGRVAGTTSWATTSPSFGPEPTSFRVPSAFLTGGATYEWQVQCACSISPLLATGWSSSASFTAPTLRTGPSAEGLAPNPASHAVRVTDPDAAGQPYRLLDATGRTVASGTVDGPIGVDALPAGLYLLQWGTEAPALLRVAR
jgi:hypothetical protein